MVSSTFSQSTRTSYAANVPPVADQYMPSQLIMISHDTLAQYWERFGHMSYYRRVDLDALARYNGPGED